MANPQPASTIYFADGKALDVVETLDVLVLQTVTAIGAPDANGIRPSWVSRGTTLVTRTNGKRTWINFANVCRIEEA